MQNYAEFSKIELQWENQVFCQTAYRELGSIWGICQTITTEYFFQQNHLSSQIF